ncbi:pentatricopeptide repeat-containing protein At3g12770-like [Prosopis cineraria]|uniref:pentatricopeptide repeat-containing protein At3g12770-like n=1 Tax=Prosopis cineraria TaxID=364024 RepID=UPI00241092DE|nr:pentatricopeptide repeat-containing protein At3g12770-like [Prosopis cineraria]XP_054793830.1 pentatricopeptide repeat-containing protein At3g12770-like [Prosopis cineraria]
MEARAVHAENCISLIKQSSNIQSLKCVHACMLRSHLCFNLFFSTKLIAHYLSLGSISLASTLFSLASHSSSPDVFLWNVMIRGFLDNSLHHRSLELYTQMRQLPHLQPDNFTFPFVLKACAYLRDYRFGIRVHADVVQFGYGSDVTVANSLLTLYGNCGRHDIARRLFDDLLDKNVVSWSSIIGAYAQNGCYRQGQFLFSQMLANGIVPNRASILNAMACVHTEKEADHVRRFVMDNELDLDRLIQNATMRMYARCGRMDVARALFDGIIDKDLVCWTSMIESYAGASMPLEALGLFRQMILLKINPDSVTLLAVVCACSQLACFQQARFIHGFVIRNCFQNQVSLETSVVDLYVKCGNLAYARRVFDQMQEKNEISCSTMISGYGIHGHAREALDLFDQMKALRQPDLITFVSVLSACSHGGLIQEGWECFNSMSRDFGIRPVSEHYACVVDLLGRAGRLCEAHDFIQKMPIKPGAAVWGALLGASRIHSNVEMAELAAKYLLELDSNNAGRYVLLSNIYASCGKRIEADMVRAQMKQRRVRKIAGQTTIHRG